MALDISTASTPPRWDLDDSAVYLNRELSWLDFNDRVLAEAQDPRNPPLERVKFLAITASNLDEFYAKRVGWLQRVRKSGAQTRTVDGLTIAEQRVLVVRRCLAMRRAIEHTWRDELAPVLAEHELRIVSFSQLDTAARQRLSAYFEEAIFPILTPLVVDPAHPFPFISSASLSLTLNVRAPAGGPDRFARIKVPQNRARLIDAGEGRFVLLEDLIGAHVHLLFPGMVVTERHVLRVLRSIEVGDTGEEADDLVELIESELRRRRLADAVALEITGELAGGRMELLLSELGLSAEDVYVAEGPLGLADFFQLASLGGPGLADPSFVPAVPAPFLAAPETRSIFATLRSHEVLVHHPYESFDATVVRFIEEAAADPAVLAIKQTMYRTSPDSPILESLINAAGRGKQVAVIVELTARFDEANNIEWARRLEDAGVHVAYGERNLKIHSKICLVVREEADGVVMYAHVGTGNYNSRTARIYTDLGLFTADPQICADLVRIFNRLTGFAEAIESRELLVAPNNLRAALESRVRSEIEAARAGRPARVILKMNALEDLEFTHLLYEASQAGVRVDLVIRGICRLRPGVPGLSDNVRVVSVIGRFLEHSRIFMFLNGGEPEYFIGSADIMKRNLDERIEVLAPVRRPEHQRQLHEILELMLADERQGWRLHDSSWSRDPSAAGPGTHDILLARAPFS